MKLIKDLENIFGISGYEKPIFDFIKDKLDNVCDEIKTDSMGNLLVKKYGKNKNKTITLVTYMDEPGIIITDITNDGYLKFELVGRAKPQFLVSKVVKINNIEGIISLKAIHLTTKKDRERPVKVSDLFIDIGAKTRKEAEKYVIIGDYGMVSSPFVEFGNNAIKGRGIGGRVGCDILINILNEELPCNIQGIFTTQREILSRGMVVASKDVEGFAVIFLDCIDGKTQNNENLPVVGKGAVVFKRTKGGVINDKIYKLIIDVAGDKGISLQEYFGDFSGQDALFKEEGKNIPSVTLGIPVKYQQSFSQVADLEDKENLNKLIKNMVYKIAGEEELV